MHEYIKVKQQQQKKKKKKNKLVDITSQANGAREFLYC
jgi:hypothetical protein